MNKLLIISYFFPPCNLTASFRAFNWAKYLNEYGYDPIILTRKWDHSISLPKDIGRSSKNFEIEVKKTSNFKIIYMPYRASKKDNLFLERPDKVYTRKILSTKELFLQNFKINALPYSNIYYKAEELIQEFNINKIIITGNPFPLFHFGYQLKKKFPDIKWIADYRDDWTTSELNKKNNIIDKILFVLEKRSEKKWVSTSKFITSVSEHYVNKISSFVKKPGHEILNGFDEIIEKNYSSTTKSKDFIITYNGTLYQSQRIEPFLTALKKIIKEYSGKINILINFPGLAYDNIQMERVVNLMINFKQNVKITGRIDRSDVIKLQQNSDLLLMIAHDNIKGIPSSKLYEYIGLQKQILLYPNDNDIIEKTLIDTGLGIICNSQKDIEDNLRKLIDTIIKDGKLCPNVDTAKISKYSRKYQVRKLSKLLDLM